MKPVLHEPKGSEGTKPVRLLLREDFGDIELAAVDGDGEEVAILLTFDSDGVVPEDGARECLEQEGYDTSFAGWSKDGSMIIK